MLKYLPDSARATAHVKQEEIVALVSAMKNEIKILAQHFSFPEIEFRMSVINEIFAAQAKTDEIASILMTDAHVGGYKLD